MPFRCKVIVALAFAYVMIACNEGANVEVELDVFSGRPNPKWELPPDKASNLLATIQSKPEVKVDVPVPGLGYRGFIVQSGGRSIRVYHGFIIVEEHGSTRTFRDTANIEAELSAEARQHGYADLVSDVPGPH